MKKCQWQNCGGPADYRLYLEGGFVGYSCHSHAIAAMSSGMEIIPIKQFRQWGAQGGKKSTRKLTSQEAKRMVAIREQKRAQNKVD